MLTQSLSTSRLGPADRRLREKLTRIEAGLTHAQVGQRVGKPKSFISKIEVGERDVGFIVMQAFARVCGKPLSNFEDMAEANEPAPL